MEYVIADIEGNVLDSFTDGWSALRAFAETVIDASDRADELFLVTYSDAGETLGPALGAEDLRRVREAYSPAMTSTTGASMRLADMHGAVLSGRTQAGRLLQSLVQELEQHGHAVLDFEGVERVSAAFADEMWRFVEIVGEERIELQNLSPGLDALVRVKRSRRHVQTSR